jgi:formyltetrahydrofolate deformylase
MLPDSYTLSMRCPGRPGIVAAIANALMDLGGNITEAQQFDDPHTQHFVSRIGFTRSGVAMPIQSIRLRLAEVLGPFGGDWRLLPRAHRKRIIIMVSQLDHCLVDLLYRQRSGELNAEIVAVVSNHPQSVHASVDFGDIPYIHLPITPITKEQQEEKLVALVDELQTDLVVLARYMQVLSNDLCRQLEGRCINIHHSFLPGFKGAKPYHQAHARGVKLIGATAHYVTGDLDEGPIIAQSVEPTSHRDTPDSLIRKGRDIERRVLASAVRDHLADRVFTNGATTVVFPE